MAPSFGIGRKPVPTVVEAAKLVPFHTRAHTNKPLPPLPASPQWSSQASKPKESNGSSARQEKPVNKTGRDVIKAAGLRKRVAPTRVLPCDIDYQSDSGSSKSTPSSGNSRKDLFISPNPFFGSIGNGADSALWSSPVQKELNDPRYRIMLDWKWRRVMPVPPPGLFFTKW